MIKQRFGIYSDQRPVDSFGLPWIKREDQLADLDAWLIKLDNKLCLDQNLIEGLAPLCLDFTEGKYAYRLKQTRSLKEPLAKACGLSKGRRPKIIDATAGLAQDSLLLAAMGSEVQMLEQHPLVYGLVFDALQRAKAGPDWFAPIIERLKLWQGSSAEYLDSHCADVVYLDPMYPEHPQAKKAKVKKGMQILRLLSGTETNTEQLFEAAHQAATQRLVVKRPDWAESLSNINPSTRIETKSHHFDIYLK